MKYVASCSFGKDSMASVILARRYGEPLDEVVYCEIMFDQNTSAEIPEHRDFIYHVAIPKLKSWGIPVTVLHSHKNYLQCFFRVCGKRSKYTGMFAGFPIAGRCVINSVCKMPPIEKYWRDQPTDVIQYVGIAPDEPKRLAKLEGTNKVSLLAKYGVTEDEAKRICAGKPSFPSLFIHTPQRLLVLPEC